MKPWNPIPVYELVPEHLLTEFQTDVIVRALGHADVGPEHLEGAARFFASRTFEKDPKKDRALVPTELVERMRARVEASPPDEYKRARFRAAFRAG